MSSLVVPVWNDIKKLKESSHEFVIVALVSDGEHETCLDDMDHVKIPAVVLDAASRKQSLYLKVSGKCYIGKVLILLLFILQSTSPKFLD